MPIGASAYGRAKQRHNTPTNWDAANPVLAFGEFGVAYDGLTPVVKVGDGVRQWVDLPALGAGTDMFANLLDVDLTTLTDGDVATWDSGTSRWVNAAAGGGGGGGPVGFGQAYPTAMTLSTSSGGGSGVPTSWSGGGGLIVPGSFGFGFTDPGWYQVSVMIWAGFTGTLPNFLRVSLQTYDVAEAFGDFAVLPAPAGGTASLGTTTSRSLPGVVATMTSPVFYQDDSGVTGTNACQIRLGWDNDAAALESANGGSPASAVHADITRVA